MGRWSVTPRWRRRLKVILACFPAGIAVNVAVAWLLAARAEFPRGGRIDVVTVHRPVWLPAGWPGSFAARVTDTLCATRLEGWFGTPLDSIPPAGMPVHGSVTIIRTGFPFTSMQSCEGVMAFSRQPGSPASAFVVGARVPSLGYLLGGAPMTVFPVQPLVVPFAINSALYAIGLAWVASRVRHRRRRSRSIWGLCPRCGYDQRDLAVCPECGEGQG